MGPEGVSQLRRGDWVRLTEGREGLWQAGAIARVEAPGLNGCWIWFDRRWGPAWAAREHMAPATSEEIEQGIYRWAMHELSS